MRKVPDAETRAAVADMLAADDAVGRRRTNRAIATAVGTSHVTVMKERDRQNLLWEGGNDRDSPHPYHAPDDAERDPEPPPSARRT